MSAALLEARGLVKHFPIGGGLLAPRQAVHAVDGVDLAIGAGETLAVIGESGCGKTTLARTLTGLIPASAGTVLFAGDEISRLGRRGRRRFRREWQADPVPCVLPR